MAEASQDHPGSPRLVLAGITKQFPECLANDHVDLAIMPGEIHALLGENGAGKSTLVRIIYGLLRADGGELRWEGTPITIANPAAARRLGIGMVFQHFALFETLTVVENIALGLDQGGDLKTLSRRIAEVSKHYGLQVDPQRHVHALSVGERQRVEIVRCLLQSPRLLIMDEPTSVLTPREVERLFVVLRRLAGEGCSILYISHKLDEIRALCERATVLRQGRVVASCDPRRETAASLAQMMVGRTLPAVDRPPGEAGGEVLAIDGLSLAAQDPFGVDLAEIGLSVRAGEIVGIAGVAGNGQTELLRALSGERPAPPATIRLDGIPIGRLGPAARRARGLAFVPEERLGRGAVAEMTLAENALLTGYSRGLVSAGWVRGGRVRRFARRIRERFGVIAAAGIDAEAHSLSGGNLQKFIIGREILLDPRLLVAAHPTWGVDIGAALAIRKALLELRSHGAALLIVSEDLDELFEMCDRIAVIARGRLSPARAVADASLEELGVWMSGLFDDESGANRDAA
ncbi:MAG TPA: ABC transporter ATP-binding protein [Alphaproteobacteria bacterium]|nr:ABC transporter ATP-binding protein [Alphaproteobacteria bacterium]